MVNHVRRHRFPVEKLSCENTELEMYYCKDCDFKTELTILFKQHINKNHRKSNDNFQFAKNATSKPMCR